MHMLDTQSYDDVKSTKMLDMSKKEKKLLERQKLQSQQQQAISVESDEEVELSFKGKIPKLTAGGFVRQTNHSPLDGLYIPLGQGRPKAGQGQVSHTITRPQEAESSQRRFPPYKSKLPQREDDSHTPTSKGRENVKEMLNIRRGRKRQISNTGGQTAEKPLKSQKVITKISYLKKKS